jgi:hypothetical protein
MSRGSQKQAAAGSLSTNNGGSDMVRQLRAGMYHDQRILTQYAAMDNGSTIYHDDDSYQSIAIEYDALGVHVEQLIEHMPDMLSDGADVAQEVALAIIEQLPAIDHDQPHVLTDTALRAAFSAAHKYIYRQKAKPALKTVYLDDLCANVDESSAPSDYIRVLQYFDIPTLHDYYGYMSLYERLQRMLTATQSRVLRGLLRGEKLAVIAHAIYGDSSQAHIMRVSRAITQIRDTAARMCPDSAQVRAYKA